jgi:hypothetical protein
MPSLARTLQDYDLGRLRLIAEWWGIDAPRAGAEEAAALAGQMLDRGLAAEVAQTPADPPAVDYLLERGGAPPWPSSACASGRQDRRAGPP